MPAGKPTQQEPDVAAIKRVLDITEPLPKNAHLKDKFLRLKDVLARSDAFDEIASHDQDPTVFRLAAVAALKAVLSFLSSNDLQSAALRRLLQALYELDEGHLHPLVTPPKVPHRKTDSISLQSLKAMAAAAMELLMEAGASKDQASSRVARALKKTGFKEYGGNPITSRMVAGWRDRYTGSTDAADAYAVGIFRRTIETARAKYPVPEKQAQRVLEAIAFVAAKI